MPRDSEASLALLGTASLLTSFGTASRGVIPRRASAEGPLAGARGDKKRPLGGQLFSFISSEASPCHFERSLILSFRAKPHLVISSEARNLLFHNWRPLGLRLGVTKGSIGHPSLALGTTAHPCPPEARQCRGIPHFVRDDAS
jgi:hypothetical protein